MDYAELTLVASPTIVRAANLDTIRPWREAIEQNRRLPYWKARQERFRETQDAMRKGILPLVPAFLQLKSAPLIVETGPASQSTADQSTYTYTSQTITPAANPLRWIVIGTVAAGGFGSNPTTTVGGVTATNVVNSASQTTVLQCVYFPTGSSATFSFAYSGTSSQQGYASYAITGLLDGAAFSTNTTQVTSPASFNVTSANGGAVIAIARGAGTGSNTISATNMTQTRDVALESVRLGAGRAATQTDNASYSVTSTQSGVSISLSAASWSP